MIIAIGPQDWAAFVGIIVGIIAITAAMFAVFKWIDRVNRKIGEPNGHGDVITMLTSAVTTAEDAKRAAREALRRQDDHSRDVAQKFASQDDVLARQDEMLERLTRGQSETHDMIEGLTNTQAQTTAALARLNELHEKDAD